MSSGPDSSSQAFTIQKRTLRTAGLAILALVVLAALILLAINELRAVSGSSLPPGVDTSTYQAVFLSNGQVYFGKMSAENGGYYELTHVYYLQTPATTRGRSTPPTLIKLTKELHTPKDLLMVNRRQVLYVENLDPSGRAYKLIASGG